MCNPIDRAGRVTLAVPGLPGLSAPVGAVLAAPAVRGLNYAPLTPGDLYPGDVYSVIGELAALTQRLPQALHQAAPARPASTDSTDTPTSTTRSGCHGRGAGTR